MLWVMKQDLTNVTVVKAEAAEMKQQVTVLIAHELTGKLNFARYTLSSLSSNQAHQFCIQRGPGDRLNARSCPPPFKDSSSRHSRSLHQANQPRPSSRPALTVSTMPTTNCPVVLSGSYRSVVAMPLARPRKAVQPYDRAIKQGCSAR